MINHRHFFAAVSAYATRTDPTHIKAAAEVRQAEVDWLEWQERSEIEREETRCPACGISPLDLEDY